MEAVHHILQYCLSKVTSNSQQINEVASSKTCGGSIDSSQLEFIAINFKFI